MSEIIFDKTDTSQSNLKDVAIRLNKSLAGKSISSCEQVGDAIRIYTAGDPADLIEIAFQGECIEDCDDCECDKCDEDERKERILKQDMRDIINREHHDIKEVKADMLVFVGE